MIAAVVIAVAALMAPTTLDLPPEGIWEAATANLPAQRLDPPPPVESVPVPPSGSTDSAGGRCVGWEGLLSTYSPGWSVERMSRIMFRESRCQPGARNRSSSATGLLQILGSHCPWIAGELGTWCTRDRLTDPDFNIRAAAALWREQGMGAWAL